MTLWEWALKTYPRPDVEAACLALQDDHEVNVCYLLWAAWGQVEHRALDLPAGAVLAQAWEDDVAAQLRYARRHLKPFRPGVADEPREALRGEVKRLELAAERLLLESLEAMAPGAGPATLQQAAAAWPSPPPASAVERLNLAVTNPVYGPPPEPGA
jgi:uncharacterized protein (TIGR02444 family)